MDEKKDDCSLFLLLSSLRPFLLSYPLTLLLPLFLTFAVGCSSLRPAGDDVGRTAASSDGDGAQAAAFERRVAPFEVLAAGGEPYDFPFLGGYNTPRPQLVDIDDDGDPDLFVQERTGSIAFFENTGTPGEPAFTWRTGKYRDLDVGEWYRFYDLNDDGAPDLLAEKPYSYVRYYRNTGTPSEPSFALAADTLRDASGEPIFSDRQNIPNLQDIDCNGLPDLFLGQLDGTITRYEATGEPADGVPRFRFVTDDFQNIEIVAQISQPGVTAPAPNAPNRPAPGGGKGPNAQHPDAQRPRRATRRRKSDARAAPTGVQTPQRANAKHGANTMAFADVDGDDDPDLLWGDFFEPGLLLIENTGSCQTPILQSTPKAFPPSNPLETSGYNAPTLADLGGDGDLDLLAGVLGGAFDPSRTTRSNLYFYEQTNGSYQLRTRRFLDGIDVGSSSFPALGDLDGDDDPDLLLANKTASGDARTAHVMRFENTGTPSKPSFALADTLGGLSQALHLAPALGDLTGDGKPDLLVGSWNDGIAFYRNEGTPSAPDFAPENRSFVQLQRGSHTTPALGDLDGDGDLDLVVGESSGTLNFFENTGTSSDPRFEAATEAFGEFDAGRRSVPALLDWDGDGDLDLIVGNEAGKPVYLRNDGTPQEASFRRTDADWPRLPPLATPAFADVDDDGDRDLFAGNESGGLLFYESQGR
jgi:hypothetical protein